MLPKRRRAGRGVHKGEDEEGLSQVSGETRKSQPLRREQPLTYKFPLDQVKLC